MAAVACVNPMRNVAAVMALESQQRYMDVALDAARAAANRGEVPVGGGVG